MGFEKVQPKELPPWLAGATGTALSSTVGKMRDDELAKLKRGIMARWPNVGPDDALVLQGNDRQLDQAPRETNDAFRDRLLRAPEIWEWAGTKAGIANIFAPCGISAERVQVFNSYEIVWDDNVGWWSRVFAIVDARGVWDSDGAWDDPGDYDDGGVWDSTATPADIAWLRRNVRRFKSSPSFPVTLAIVTQGDGAWDSPGVWDDGGLWDVPLSLVTYWTLGHVWEEEVWLGGTDGLWDSPGTWDDDFVS